MKITSLTELGQAIQATRKQTGITQEDFAAMLDTSHVSLLRLEKGAPGVNAGLLFHALEELGIELTISVPQAPGLVDDLETDN